jgi:hypothetical protein
VVVAQEFHPADGNAVEVDYCKELLTRWAHALRVLVKVGDVVKRGQRLHFGCGLLAWRKTFSVFWMLAAPQALCWGRRVSWLKNENGSCQQPAPCGSGQLLSAEPAPCGMAKAGV